MFYSRLTGLYFLLYIPLLYCSVAFENYEIINLGGDCQIAYQMHINGIRKYALPFDKIICAADNLEQVLLNDFGGWLEKENLELVITERSKYILDARYDTRWLHDFRLSDNFMHDYDAVFTTYQRRIERYRSLVRGQNSVVFLRKNITRIQALRLRDVVSQLYPNLNFVLVALDSTDDFKQDWHEHNIINLYLKKPIPYHWKGDNLAWIEIFKVLGFAICAQENSTTEI